MRAAAVRAAFAFAAAADAFAPVAPTPLMSLVSSAYRPTANATASAFLSRIGRLTLPRVSQAWW